MNPGNNGEVAIKAALSAGDRTLAEISLVAHASERK
jgi:hypothetical protein